MGSQASKQSQVDRLARTSFPGSFPEIFKLISCDITPEDEGTAEISSWPSNRDRRFGPGSGFEYPADRRRFQQPGRATGMKQTPAIPPAEGAVQAPLRDRNAPMHGSSQLPQERTQSLSVPGGTPKGEKEAVRRQIAYKVGDLVELWSTSQHAWCRGSVEKIEGKWVHIAYASAEGQPMTKIMPNGHEEIRPWSTGQVQGNENIAVQSSAQQLGQTPWDPAFKPPSAPPRPDGISPQPQRQPPLSPLPVDGFRQPPPPPPPPLEVATEEQGISIAAPWEPPNPLFDLSLGLSLPDFLKPGPSYETPAPAPSSFDQNGLFGGLGSPDLLGSVRMQQGGALGSVRQPLSQGWQGNQSQSQPGSVSLPNDKAWIGFGHSQSQPQSLAVSPGELGATPPRKKKYVEPNVQNVVPLIPGVERIEPEVVQQLIQNNQAVLIDLRDKDRSAGLIPGAIHVQAIDSVPFPQKIPGLIQRFQNQSLVIFTCQYSCHRAPQCSNWYREQTDPRQRVAIMTGGFRKWEGIGMPCEALGSNESNKAADAHALQQGAQFAMAADGQHGQLGAGIGSHTIAGGQAPGLIPPSPPRWF